MPTTELTASRWGEVGVSSKASHALARDASTGDFANINPTGINLTPTSYIYNGRSSTYSIDRFFAYYDASNLNIDTVSSATIKIRTGTLTNSARLIIASSSAFGGDGSTDISTSDYSSWTDLSFYSVNNGTPFATNTTGSLSLLSNARTDLENNGGLIIGIIDFDYDAGDVDGGGGSDLTSRQYYNLIGDKVTLELTYTTASSPPPTSYKDVSGVTTQKISGVEYNLISGV